MSILKMPQEQKDKILNELMYTRTTFKKIAKNNDISIQDLFAVMNEYCEKNGYENFKRTFDGPAFEPKKDTEKLKRDRRMKLLKKLEEVERWCEENERIPRSTINGVLAAKEGEIETEEQEELRLGILLYKARRRETHEDIVETIRKIDEKYKSFKMPKLCKKNLMNLQIIEYWCEKNGRIPRSSIDGVELREKRIRDWTEDEKELSLGILFRHIKTRAMEKYRGKALEEIENEIDRQIVEIIRRLDEIEQKTQYEDKENKLIKKVNYVQTLGNEKMKKMVVNLIKTKNATEEQVKEIADFYGVDLGKVVNIQEKR